MANNRPPSNTNFSSLLTLQTSLNSALPADPSVDYPPRDPIQLCGPEVLSALRVAPQTVTALAHAKLHAYRFDQVPDGWRRAYVEGLLWEVRGIVDRVVKAGGGGGDESEWVSKVVDKLDRASIIAGACGRKELVREVVGELEEIGGGDFMTPAAWSTDGDTEKTSESRERAAKRRKTMSLSKHRLSQEDAALSFSTAKVPAPPLQRPIPKKDDLDFMSFQGHLDRRGGPIIVSNHLTHWPALSDSDRQWNDPRYWWKRTIGGRRLVPVEIGRSYTEEGWGQKLMSFGDFIERLMDQKLRGLGPDGGAGSREDAETEARREEAPVWYLAQHDLLDQIPRLRNDIAIPDYCYCAPPPTPREKPGATGAEGKGPNGSSSHGDRESASPEPPSDPMLNMWLGPANTISPLHTDPHHNILCQVVGSKYVRLYAPEHSARLHPRGVGEDGVNMDNTSRVDLDEYIELFEKRGEDITGESRSDEEEGDDGDSTDDVEEVDWLLEARNEARRKFLAEYPGFRGTPFVEGIINEGDCLYIPRGWWHYVRSLSVSASVSFWWD